MVSELGGKNGQVNIEFMEYLRIHVGYIVDLVFRAGRVCPRHHPAG